MSELFYKDQMTNRFSLILIWTIRVIINQFTSTRKIKSIIRIAFINPWWQEQEYFILASSSMEEIEFIWVASGIQFEKIREQEVFSSSFIQSRKYVRFVWVASGIWFEEIRKQEAFSSSFIQLGSTLDLSGSLRVFQFKETRKQEVFILIR